MERAKEEFIHTHPTYGYGGRIDGIYAAEFADRLKDTVYFDHGGSGLYTQSHLTATQEYLSKTLLLNPHTDSATSTIIDNIREQVLNYMGVNSRSHTIVFTYNTSSALNLLGSIFPFQSTSELAATMDNHNSVLGLREKLKPCGHHARYSVVTLKGDPSDENGIAMNCACSSSLQQQHDSNGANVELLEPNEIHPCLFVLPAESNFDGRIYDLSLADMAQSYNSSPSIRSSNPLAFHHTTPHHRWYTLVDASKHLCTSPIDLSQHSGVDFVTISFYKMFGYPTGLAGLIIRNEAAEELWGLGNGRLPPVSTSSISAAVRPLPSPSRPSLSQLRHFFAGGTVNAVIADEDFHLSKTSGRLHELLEDGTIAFTSIIAIPYGIALFKSLHPTLIHQHTTTLANELFDWLKSQSYETTRRPLCKFYGSRGSIAHAHFGPTLNLNFFDDHGQVIGYKTIEKIALVNKIFLRSGSFCNPGACQLSYPLSSSQIRSNIAAGYACWEDGENLGGVINGSIRITLGWNSRWEDLERFKQFVTAEIKTIGHRTFITNQQMTDKLTDSAASSTTTSAVETSTTSSHAVISPFDFQLPTHFLQPTKPNQIVANNTVSPVAAVVPLSAAPMVSSLVSPPLAPLVPSSPYVLSSLTIYPLKSCGGVPLSSWYMCSSSTGSTLFMDREFVLLDAYGVALSQKTLPQLQRIRPSINLDQKTLTLEAPQMDKIVIQLSNDHPTSSDGLSDAFGHSQVASLCELNVCGQSALGYVYNSPHHAAITDWLTKVVGKYTCLARKSSTLYWPNEPIPIKPSVPSHRPSSTVSSAVRTSFANEGDFLLVNAASVREVERRLHKYVEGHKLLKPHKNDVSIPPARFRPNFVIDSSNSILSPFAEDDWSNVRIGPFGLKVEGGCGRCVMVNIDPITGERESSLYALLNTLRKKGDRVLFGSLLSELRPDRSLSSSLSSTDSNNFTTTRWSKIHVGMGCQAE